MAGAAYRGPGHIRLTEPVTTDPDDQPPSAGPAPVSTFAPLQVPAYRRFWSAALVSHLGTFLQMTAGPWVMQEMTDSPLLVALVTTSLTLPRLLLTLPAGALADIVDRRSLMLVGQTTSAVSVAAMAVLTATGLLTPVLLLGLSFLLGVGNAIGLPSFQTLIPDLVPRPMMAQAITLNSGAFNVARAIGPAIGGVLVGAGLASTAFGANAASYLAIVGVLLTFPRATVQDTSRMPLWRSTATGMRYARFTRPIRVMLAVSAMFAFTTASIQSLLPVKSTELGLGGSGYGMLYGLFGAGALVGVLTRERARARFRRRMLPGAVLTFGVSGVVLGLAPPPRRSPAPRLTVNGLCWVYTLVTMNATVQLLAPRWVRSRVVSLYLLAIGLQPVGAFAAGLACRGHHRRAHRRAVQPRHGGARAHGRSGSGSPSWASSRNRPPPTTGTSRATPATWPARPCSSPTRGRSTATTSRSSSPSCANCVDSGSAPARTGGRSTATPTDRPASPSSSWSTTGTSTSPSTRGWTGRSPTCSSGPGPSPATTTR